MTLGFIGLGKMGSQMVARLLKDGHKVVVTDLNRSAVDMAVQHGAVAAADRTALAKQLGDPAIVWIMIPAQFVDAEIEALLGELPRGSIIIDGGNSDFRLTRERGQKCAAAGVELVDVGTSGGVLGLDRGFSMMAGGSPEAFQTVEPIIKSLAQPGGYRHFGKVGAGHYIKMVHNAIEYGLMEAYAEGYGLLQEGRDYPGLDLAAISQVWQHGSIIASNLGEVTGKVLGANPTLEGIEGYVAESGEARWTLEVAADQGLSLPVVQAAMEVRLRSQKGQVSFATKLLAGMRNVFGGHAVNK